MAITLAPVGPDSESAPRADRPPTSGFSLGGVIGLVMAMVGVLIGSQALSDNSFLTHLATGRQMISEGFVQNDVFTWTSQGRDLVVQSWLASLLYGTIDSVVGLAGIRLLMAATAGTLAWISWRLSARSESVITRVAIMVPVLMVGGVMWTERPLLIALVLFGVTILVADGSGRPRVLTLVGVVWIGVHGSWPLGVVLLVARWIGGRIDRTDTTRESEALKWLSLGFLLGGVLNPHGPALLFFPVRLLGRRETLSHVAEWRSPSFDALYAQAFLVLLLLVVVAVARRSSWRTLVPLLIFVAAALMSRRNIPVATLVMIPVAAAGLPALGRLNAAETSNTIRLAGRTFLGLLALFPLLLIGAPHLDLDRYPVEAINLMEGAGLSPAEVRVVHPDYVGNYLDLRFGDAGVSWIDDRYELHDQSLISDYLVLLDGLQGWQEILETTEGDVLLWPTDAPITTLAGEVADWNLFWSDDDWTVLCRPGLENC